MQVFLQIVTISLQTDWSGRTVLTKGKVPLVSVRPNGIKLARTANLNVMVPIYRLVQKECASTPRKRCVSETLSRQQRANNGDSFVTSSIF